MWGNDLDIPNNLPLRWVRQTNNWDLLVRPADISRAVRLYNHRIPYTEEYHVHRTPTKCIFQCARIHISFVILRREPPRKSFMAEPIFLDQ